MNSISTSRIVPYTAQEMFTLVNDIESYPEFLPWCKSSTIHQRTDDEIRATLVLSAKGFTQSITTHNRMQKDKMIEMKLIEGPLKHLESFWRFEMMENSTEENPKCHIFFDIEFEFTNRFIRMALEPFFDKVAETMVGSFLDRAEAIYKK